MREPESDEFKFIREMLGSLVPFATRAGVTVDVVGDGTSSATLADAAFTKNHLGTQHAGALFTVAEAASGAAMAGALAPVVADALSVVKQSTASYHLPARGPITATAQIDIEPSALRAGYERNGRAAFSVAVELRDSNSVSVAMMEFEWVVKAPA